MRLNFPTLLTVLRLAAVPLLGVVFLVLPRPAADFVALVLFISAALTDYVDGEMARAWRQVTKLGTMLDPIADKALVVIALAVLLAYSGLAGWIMLPATVILFREVFVSGLREFLGETAGTLKVTRLAKWKTAVQMIAISALLAKGIFEHYVAAVAYGMDEELFRQVLAGEAEDVHGLRGLVLGLNLSLYGGIALLWVAALLTAITGWDYYAKARPYLQEEKP